MPLFLFIVATMLADIAGRNTKLRHSGAARRAEPGIHFFQHSCRAMDSGFARYTRAPE
jgi:hypothetical protein